VCFNWSTRASTVPGENFPTSQRKAPDGNKDVWNCRSSRQGKDFLTCITTDCLSNLHDLDQISRNGSFLPKKWVLGDHFFTENFNPGDQNFQDQNSGDSTRKAAVLVDGLSIDFVDSYQRLCCVWLQESQLCPATGHLAVSIVTRNSTVSQDNRGEGPDATEVT